MKELATPRKLAELLSEKAGVPLSDVMMRLQYLREAGLQPKGVYGDSKPPRLTLRAAAVQVLGLTAPYPLAVVNHVRRVGALTALTADLDRYATPEFGGSGVEHVLPLLTGRATYLGALVALLRAMMQWETRGHWLTTIKGIGVTSSEAADNLISAWIAPEPPTAWTARGRDPVRVRFGGRVLPFDSAYQTTEVSQKVHLLDEVAQLLGRAAAKGEVYGHDEATAGRPPYHRHGTGKSGGVQRTAQAG
jgi:hypothetical protein